jgi:hypothetical protein
MCKYYRHLECRCCGTLVGRVELTAAQSSDDEDLGLDYDVVNGDIITTSTKHCCASCKEDYLSGDPVDLDDFVGEVQLTGNRKIFIPVTRR